MAGASHIADVMEAVRQRILTLRTLFQPLAVEIAHPAQYGGQVIEGTHLVTLFVYRIEPDHRAMVSTPGQGLAVRLNTLVTVYGGEKTDIDESIGSLELRILSHIIRLFLEEPKIGPIRLRETLPSGPMTGFVVDGVTVEAQLLSLEMEEINHIWTTQGETPYRTSLVYSFNFALVTPLTPGSDGPPVLSTQVAPPGGPAGPGDIGIDPAFTAQAAPTPVRAGALVLREPGIPARLLASKSVPAAQGDISLRLLGVASAPATFNLIVERFDLATGAWVALNADVAQIAAIAQSALQAGPPPAGTAVSFANPDAAALIRLSLVHPTEPAQWDIAPAHLAVEVAGP